MYYLLLSKYVIASQTCPETFIQYHKKILYFFYTLNYSLLYCCDLSLWPYKTNDLSSLKCDNVEQLKQFKGLSSPSD